MQVSYWHWEWSDPSHSLRHNCLNQDDRDSSPIQSAWIRFMPATTPSTVTLAPIRSSLISSHSMIQASSVVVRIIPRFPRLSVPEMRIRPALTTTPLFKSAIGAALRAHRLASRHCAECRPRDQRRPDLHCKRRALAELRQTCRASVEGI